MNLRDLSNDILKCIGYSTDDLEDVIFNHDVFNGNLAVDEPAVSLCSSLHHSSFRDNIMSEVDNTFVLFFDYCNINDIICKVGVYISDLEQGGVDLEARILSYYASLFDGKIITVSSLELYQALHEK